MKNYRKRLQKSFFASHRTLLTAHFILAPFAATFLQGASVPLMETTTEPEATFTINFRNISATEYVRFVSRVTGLNFIFNDEDLLFTVTIVSEKPVSKKNVIAALLQILEANGLVLNEQGGAVMISKSNAGSQIAELVSSTSSSNSAIVTRIFPVNNVSVSTASTIMRSMISKAALLQSSPETHQIIITDIAANIDKIAILLTKLDVPYSPLETTTYQVQFTSAIDLCKTLHDVIAPFQDSNVFLALPQNDKNFIFLVGTPFLLNKAQEVLAKLDIPSAQNPILSSGNQEVFIYKPQFKTSSNLLTAVQGLAKSLQNPNFPATSALILMLNSAKPTDGGENILFVGSAETWGKAFPLIQNADNTEEQGKVFWLYQVQHASPSTIEAALHETAENMENSGISDADHLIEAIDSMRYISSSNSLLFVAPTSAIERLKQLLPSLDKAGSLQNTFFIYKTQHTTPEKLQLLLRQTASSIQTAGYYNRDLVNCIDSATIDPDKNALIFTGSPETISKVKELIAQFDSSTNSSANLFIYKLKFIAADIFDKALEQIETTLDPSLSENYKLAKCLEGKEYINETASYIFRGDDPTLTRVKNIINDIDNPEDAAIGKSSTFQLYKLQNASGNVVIDQLQQILPNLPAETPLSIAVKQSIGLIKWIPDNNSLLIAGTPQTIEKVIALVEKFDVASETPTDKGSFFVYTAKNKPATLIEVTLTEYSESFKQSGLHDPAFLNSLDTLRVIPESNQIIITGSQESIQKVKDLILLIDNASSGSQHVQKIGDSFFLIYPLQNLTFEQFKSVVKNLITHLPPHEEIGTDVKKSITSMQWIKDTNSVMFVGTQDTINKVLALIKKVDTQTIPLSPGSLAPGATYEIYQPLYLSAKELLSQLQDFMQSLLSTGLTDKSLSDTIANIKVITKNNSLIISGPADGITHVMTLIKRFDTSAKGNGEGPIHGEASFMVYKVQYHSGQLIQEALKKLALTFAAHGATPNPGLSTCIENVQWIQTTNSLLASGDPIVLAKLKALVQEIDIPLRQVFIEVLVLDTTLSDSLQFGLEWSSKGQLKNKVALNSGNFAPGAGGGGNSTLGNAMYPVNLTTPPTPSNFSLPVPGFDLGIIGDIIMHKGQSFLSMGSFLEAVQVDDDTVIVMNPKIVTQDTNNSTIFVGQNIPYIGSQIINTPTTGGAQTNGNIEYRDVGVSLSITPTIGKDDVITMDIVYTMSAQTTNTSGAATSSGFQGVQTNQMNMSTRVHVPDKHFVVLSGMLQDKKEFIKSAVPCLGSIPVIGLAFTQVNDAASSTNTMIFIRPQIIHDFDEYKHITENQEDLYRNLGATKTVREIIDAGIDWVKTPDNE